MSTCHGCLNDLSFQEIWRKKEIYAALNILPGSQEIQTFMAMRDIKQATAHPNAPLTGILLASFAGNNEFLQAILQKTLTANVRDKDGR